MSRLALLFVVTLALPWLGCGESADDTGYAIVANEFIKRINADLGSEMPLVDIEAVFKNDAEHPDRFDAVGFDPHQCD